MSILSKNCDKNNTLYRKKLLTFDDISIWVTEENPKSS